MRIAFDTQVVSYFLLANQAGYNPAADPDSSFAKQKVAAFCLWMYVGDPAVVPTVFKECNAIRNDEWKKREHFNWNAYNLSEVQVSWLDPNRVEARAAELSAFHHGPKNLNDCRIVAECEEPDSPVDALAAFDSALIKHLASKSRILIATPYDCLLQAGIPENASPRILKPEHPLCGATWWKLSNVLGRWSEREHLQQDSAGGSTR